MKGKKFGRWTIIDGPTIKEYPSGRKRPGWICRCDCGTEKIIEEYELIIGRSRSCGCLRIEETSKRMRGVEFTDEHKKNIAEAHKGKKMSKEARKNMKKSWKTGHHNQKGENNYNFKGRRVDVNGRGYVYIYIPNHPYARKTRTFRGYVAEHRVVVEKKIGRYLKPNELVHHINGIRDDNRPENLTITDIKKHERRSYTKSLQERIRKLEERLRKVGG